MSRCRSCDHEQHRGGCEVEVGYDHLNGSHECGCPDGSDVHRCAEDLFDMANAPTNPMAGLPGAMAVSEEPPTVTADEFPAQHCRCPHGVEFWAYPNAERIAVLREMNETTDTEPA